MPRMVTFTPAAGLTGKPKICGATAPITLAMTHLPVVSAQHRTRVTGPDELLETGDEQLGRWAIADCFGFGWQALLDDVLRLGGEGQRVPVPVVDHRPQRRMLIRDQRPVIPKRDRRLDRIHQSPARPGPRDWSSPNPLSRAVQSEGSL